MTKDFPEQLIRIFAIGTLKRGFPFHDRGLADAHFLGLARSIEPYPLVIAGPWYAPMMLDEPGFGLRIAGELYAVNRDMLGRLDRLESVGKPGNIRRLITVELAHDGATASAFAFMKARQLARPLHSGYLESYQDRRFIPPERRGGSP